jgi:hypothetical protein
MKKQARKLLIFLVLSLIVSGVNAQARKFEAIGPTFPLKQKPEELGAVRVNFDLLPTTMSFDLPWTYCMVTENNIKFANLAAETYDPRDFDGTGGLASFEPGMDDEGRYVRAWIEHQSDARIVVRVRYALNNNLMDIAHPDIPSGSPYGKGDWTDEWHYIYPDGTNIRHMRIYTGLAPVSRPFGFDREPPSTVHEFMESVVIGQKGHVPTDDIEIDALTLIKMFGGHSEELIEEGISTNITFDPYPEDYGEFRDANVVLFNLKSEYKPFIIAMPYGVRMQPYMPEDDLPFVFQTWGNPPDEGYATAFGHIINYWHYRRSDKVLEQIYLSGMTNNPDPHDELVSLAWSWITDPPLRMKGLEDEYGVYTYDPAQKAYIVPRKGRGPVSLEWILDEPEDGPTNIINPAFIIKDWDREGFELNVDGKRMEPGTDFRVGYENTPTGSDLVLWIRMHAREAVEFELSPL